MTNLILRGPGSEATRFRLAHRWFWWGSDNVTLFGVWYAKHATDHWWFLSRYLKEAPWVRGMFAKRQEESVQTARHEGTHARRQAELGHVRYLVKYVLSPAFRRQEEALAVAAQTDNRLTVEIE